MKRFLKRLLQAILLIIIVFSIYAFVSGKTYLFKAILYNFANINDYEKFSNNTVAVSTPKAWKTSASYNKINYPDSINTFLETLSSIGLVVVTSLQGKNPLAVGPLGINAAPFTSCAV